MRSSKFCLIFLILILPLWGWPGISKAAESKKIFNLSIPPQYDDFNYVCVQFKGFPLWVLWQLRKMESSIRQQIPEGLHVGRKMKSGQGYLLFTYQKKPEGVLLSVRYRRISIFDSRISTMGDAPAFLNQQFILRDNSNPAVLETLKALFSRCCLAWEKDRMAVGLEEIVDSGIRIATNHPDRNSFDSTISNR